jgi:hypothetical protein
MESELKLAGCFESSSSSSGRPLLIFERQIFLFCERYFRLPRRRCEKQKVGFDTSARQQARTCVQILILRRLFSNRPITFSSDRQTRRNIADRFT